MKRLIIGSFILIGLVVGAEQHANASDVSLNDALSALCIAPLCVDYSGSNAIVSSDGTRIAVKDWAPYNKKKPTFLFLHGYPHGQGIWIAQLPLVLKYRLVTMDRRGGGLSGVPNVGSYEDTNYSADIQAVIKKLGLNNVILVVHSYGGIDLNSFVKNHPSGLNSVIGVVTVSAVMDLFANPNPVNITISPEAEALIIGTLSPDPSNPTQASRDTTSNFVNKSHYQPFPAILSNAFLNMDMETPLSGRLGQLSSGFAHSDSTPYVAQINVPVLILVGLQDFIVVPANAQWWQDHLTHAPRIQRVNLSNVGHIPQLEAPILFNQALDAFAGSL